MHFMVRHQRNCIQPTSCVSCRAGLGTRLHTVGQSSRIVLVIREGMGTDWHDRGRLAIAHEWWK